MKNRKKIFSVLTVLMLLASAVMMVFSSTRVRSAADADRVAAGVSRALQKRMDLLDKYIAQALAQDPSGWLSLEGLPSDMVVYRYIEDTLQSWVGEFPVSNDNIHSGTYLPVITNPARSLVSPLSNIGESARLVNMGQQWFIAKSQVEDNCRVIAGIEILGNMNGQRMRVNPALHINPCYAVRSLAETGGSAVYLDGEPVFKVICETLDASLLQDPGLLWFAFAFLIAAAFCFLLAERNVKRLFITLLVLVCVMTSFYLWGRNAGGRFIIFSPVLYAGGAVFSSLGAVVIANLAILLIFSCIYIARDSLSGMFRNDSSRWVFLAFDLALIVLLLAYTHLTLKSIILNSGISLELYKPAEFTPFCAIVYASFISMLMSVPMLAQLGSVSLPGRYRGKFNAFSMGNKLLYSVFIAVYLISISSTLGFRKEQDRMEVLANRLSFDRDISLEMRLLRIENQIAEDMIISALSVFNNTASTIQGRILDTYFSRTEQDYLVSVYVFNDSNNTRAALDQYNRLLKDGVPIADNSRFLYVKRDSGHSYYVGLFLYLVEGNGISRVLVCLESRDIRGNKGYASIFGITPPGKVTIPAGYSYARYEGTNLKSSHGSFAYPTKLSPKLRNIAYELKDRSETMNGYTHFFTLISDNELVVISRVKTELVTYLVTGILIAIIPFLIMCLMSLNWSDRRNYGWTFFRTRILGLLLISLILTLVAMAFVSIFFVASRNETNMHTMMSEKILSICSMLEAETVSINEPADFNFQQLRRLMEQVSSDTNSDISLYTPDGKIMMSTTPMVFDRQFLGNRINGKAYSEIVYSHKKYHIQRESSGPVNFYSLYAPLMSREGNVLAIICSPYSEENYDFEQDVVTHTMTVVAIFLFFLIFSTFMVSRIVDKLFGPLGEMSRKMSSADLDSLEYINYDRNDEITSIVQAYNRMVTELSESSRKLAQAERDKAWSGMARQVAHEIKNPLTPMKLQLQRVIRLKQKGDPVWQERFDEASKVLLDHIDILTDTANEFSTFAKLYTETPAEIALDTLIRGEIAMFDNRDNIEFIYLGFEDVKVMGPKPQLTRVFVNLLNNAVQAIGDRENGKIVVSLRNSMEDGFYDIVFEDNGPGVSEENESKLFSPNFTTKNGGSGLGLAISRSILERCGARISYHRSYTLGGACFSISYPKEMPEDFTSDGRKSEPDNR